MHVWMVHETCDYKMTSVPVTESLGHERYAKKKKKMAAIKQEPSQRAEWSRNNHHDPSTVSPININLISWQNVTKLAVHALGASANQNVKCHIYWCKWAWHIDSKCQGAELWVCKYLSGVCDWSHSSSWGGSVKPETRSSPLVTSIPAPLAASFSWPPKGFNQESSLAAAFTFFFFFFFFMISAIIGLSHVIGPASQFTWRG